MPPMTIACPGCGRKQTLNSENLGGTVVCPCGNMFSASPVFAVTPARPGWLRGRAKHLVAAAVVVSALGGTAAWLATRPHAAAPAEAPPGPVAEAPAGPKVEPPEPKPEPKPAPEPEPKPEPKADVPPPEPKPEPKPEPPAPKAPPPGPKLTPVQAVTLFDAFDLPSVEVRARYDGKPVEVVVRGKPGRDAQGKPFFGGVVVTAGQRTPAQVARLKPQQQKWEREGYPPSVLCYPAADQTATLEALPADREVTLRGVCQGRRDDKDAYMGYVVVVTDCAVVK